MNDGFAGYLVRVWRGIGGELSPVLCILFRISQLLLLSLSQNTLRTFDEEKI